MAGLLLCPVAARAELKWDQTELSRTLEAGELKAELPFTFTNESDHSVSIIEVRSSCGCCTAAAPTKRVYEAGEKGQVTAVFTVGMLSGELEKKVYVTTSDDPKTPKVLTVKVNVLKAARLAKSEVSWTRGEAAEEKTVHIAAQTTTVLVLEPLNPAEAKLVSARIEPDQEAVGFLLKVRPLDTSRPLNFPLRLHAVVGKQKEPPIMLLIRVK